MPSLLQRGDELRDLPCGLSFQPAGRRRQSRGETRAPSRARITSPRPSAFERRDIGLAARTAILGVVLAGGRSTRMGREKALLAFDGRPLVAYAVERLRPQ